MMCCNANGIPMMVMASTAAETKWATAIAQPKRISQIMLKCGGFKTNNRFNDSDVISAILTSVCAVAPAPWPGDLLTVS